MTVDFKALLGAKDISTLVTEAFTRLKDAGSRITNLNVGGFFRTLVELSMQAHAELYDLLVAVAPQGFAESATGQWLDLKCADIGLTRKAAAKTAGVVTFSRTLTTGNVVIPEGTIVKTDTTSSGDELRYFTTQEIILADGQASTDVPVEAEFAGSRYNVAAGLIKNMATLVPGIDSVSNGANWITSEGMDEETDDELRTRYRLKWNELSQGGTKLAYVSWAKSVSGVVNVSVDDSLPRGQGTVDVIITGTDGAPTQTLIDQVQAVINDRKPITADVLVKGPTTVPVNVTVTVQLPPDAGDIAATQAEAEKRVRGLFAKDSSLGYLPLGIGEDVYRSRIVALLMSIQHVVNASVTAPAADVAISPSELATLGVLTVTVERLT